MVWSRGLELTSLLCKGRNFSSRQERQVLNTTTFYKHMIPTQNFAVLQAYPNTKFMHISHTNSVGTKVGMLIGWLCLYAVCLYREATVLPSIRVFFGELMTLERPEITEHRKSSRVDPAKRNFANIEKDGMGRRRNYPDEGSGK